MFAFASKGDNVTIADDVIIEHPEVMHLGSDVTIQKGVCITGKPREFLIGDNVTIYPYVTFQGSPDHVHIGSDVQFFPYVFVGCGDFKTSFVEIGDHTHFAPGCVLYGWGGLKIGNYCAIAAHCMFATVRQHYDRTEHPMVTYGECPEPITLEDDVWLAANVVITGNTTVRTGCVVGANAVVTKDTEPYGLYLGIPAIRHATRK